MFDQGLPCPRKGHGQGCLPCSLEPPTHPGDSPGTEGTCHQDSASGDCLNLKNVLDKWLGEGKGSRCGALRDHEGLPAALGRTVRREGGKGRGAGSLQELRRDRERVRRRPFVMLAW